MISISTALKQVDGTHDEGSIPLVPNSMFVVQSDGAVATVPVGDIPDTIGLGTAATQDSSAFATATHDHAISEVTNLQTTLDAKALASKVVSKISSLVDAIIVSQTVGEVELSLSSGTTTSLALAQTALQRGETHAQTIAEITGLQPELDGKSTVGHTHTVTELQGFGSAATMASSAFATAAQGLLADTAFQQTGGTISGNVTVNGDLFVASTDGLLVVDKIYTDELVAKTATIEDGILVVDDLTAGAFEVLGNAQVDGDFNVDGSLTVNGLPISGGGGVSVTAGTGIAVTEAGGVATVALSTASQASLSLANSALQSLTAGTGIAVTGGTVALSTASQASLALANSALQSLPAHPHTAADITAGLALVATSNSYTDLDNKPTIPAAQVNSDWNAGSGVAQILNKPTTGATGMAVLATTSGSAACAVIGALETTGGTVTGDVEIQGDLALTGGGDLIVDELEANDLLVGLDDPDAGIVTEKLTVLGNGNVAVNGNPLGAQIILGFSGKPALNEADWLLVNTPMTIKVADAGVAYATMEAAVGTTIHLRKNAGTVGTVMWAAAANTGTVSLTSDVSLAAGDRIMLEMDNTPDADLSDIQVSLKGVL